MALTAEQTNWLQGFWAYFQKQPRPTKAGPKQDGWDTAYSVSSLQHGGGYA